MSSAIIIQARIGSTRTPRKITHLFQGESMLEYQVKRLQQAGFTNIYIATTDQEQDIATVEIAERMGVSCFRGSEHDVMGRYLSCSEYYDLDPIIRVGGDDPLLDPVGLKYLFTLQQEKQVDLVYASHTNGWIYGTAGELMTRAALTRAAKATNDPLDREHVISYLKRSEGFHRIKATPVKKELIRPDIYLSVDYVEDLYLINQILEYFTSIRRRYDFTQEELIALYDSGTLDIRNRHLHHGFED